MGLIQGEQTYRARATTGDLGETPNTHTPFVGVTFEVRFDDGQTDTVNWSGWLTDKAYARTIEALRAMGWEGDDLADLSGIDKNEVEIVTEWDGDDGQYVRVKWVNGTRRGMSEQARLSPDQKRALAAKMRSRIAALGAKQAQGQQPAQQPQQQLSGYGQGQQRQQQGQRGSLPDRARRTPENDPGFNPEDWEKNF